MLLSRRKTLGLIEHKPLALEIEPLALEIGKNLLDLHNFDVKSKQWFFKKATIF